MFGSNDRLERLVSRKWLQIWLPQCDLTELLEVPRRMAVGTSVRARQ